MSNDIHQKRDFVTGLYSGPRWKKKVAKMPDAQVVAIYLKEKAKAQEGSKKLEAEEVKKESETDDGIPF